MTLHMSTWPDGGMDLTIRLTAAEADAIGPAEAEGLVDWLDTAMWALSVLRSNLTTRSDDPRDITASDLHAVIRDMHRKLLPRLSGIQDAVIRRHGELGGSLGQLAAAMDSARSTAQDRREALDRTGPRRAAAARWERWAATPREN